MDAKLQILQGLQERLSKSFETEKVTHICRILDGILDEFSICGVQKKETKTDLLLNDFIQAKKLEECSGKTLAYYKSTLENSLHALKSVLLK